MAQYLLVNSVTYDDGATLSKDHDGVLVIGTDLYLPRAPVSDLSPYFAIDSVSFYNGSTTAKDQDGQLAVDAATERLASGGLKLTYVNPRYLLNTPIYYDGFTLSKDHDGVLVVDPASNPPVTSSVTRDPLRVVTSPSYYDGSTTSKDHDGEVIVDAVMTERGFPNPQREIVAPSASVSGSAVAVGDNSLQINSASALVSGDATATSSATVYRTMSASVYGDAVTTATASVIRHATGSCDITLTALGTLTESPGPHIPVVVPDTFPGQARAYFGEGLSPSDGVIVAQRGDVTVNNKLVPASASNFSLSGSYSGPAYSLGGPFSTSPVRLGFRKGDRLKVWGPVGNEPNHGREFTLDDPSGFIVMEEIHLPDTTVYEFMAFRRLS